MAQSTVHAHSYQHFEDLQLSANAFYDTLERTVAEYQYPKVKCRRRPLSEGGLFSSDREYLVVSRGPYKYYVCACPFGRSFFVSWWLEERQSAWAGIPLFGYLFSNAKRGKTFYELDTELMFTESIQSVVRMLVARVAATRGLRDLELFPGAGE